MSLSLSSFLLTFGALSVVSVVFILLRNWLGSGRSRPYRLRDPARNTVRDGPSAKTSPFAP